MRPLSAVTPTLGSVWKRRIVALGFAKNAETTFLPRSGRRLFSRSLVIVAVVLPALAALLWILRVRSVGRGWVGGVGPHVVVLQPLL